jgi:hypothetical protein
MASAELQMYGTLTPYYLDIALESLPVRADKMIKSFIQFNALLLKEGLAAQASHAK